MGAHPYYYFTPWQVDISAALQALRETEFKAGRYDEAMQAAEPPMYIFEMEFPPDSNSPAPGPVHSSIQTVLDDMTEDGTGSILDLQRISLEPEMFAASPVGDGDLLAVFGTLEPSRAQVEGALVYRPDRPMVNNGRDIRSDIDRGEGRYIVVYEAGKAREIFFLGYSFD